MSKYLLKMIDDKRTIVKFEAKKSYVIDCEKLNLSKVKSITIYDEDKINKFAMKKYLSEYKKLSLLFKKLSEDEDDEDGAILCLGEVQRLKGILINQYKKYLAIESYNYFIEDLELIEANLSNRLLHLQERTGMRL